MNKATMLKRWLPLMILAGLIAAVFAIGLDRYLSLEALRDNRAALLAIVEHHAFATAAGFVLVYTGAVALSLPSATVMTLAGGFLFGTWPGPRSMSSARPWGLPCCFSSRASLPAMPCGGGQVPFSIAWRKAFAGSATKSRRRRRWRSAPPAHAGSAREVHARERASSAQPVPSRHVDPDAVGGAVIEMREQPHTVAGSKAIGASSLPNALSASKQCR
jgi:hypothetical protein